MADEQSTADVADLDPYDDKPFALSEGAPDGMNLYFYIGWRSHSCSASYREKGNVDWRHGWMERERMIRRAVQEGIQNG